MPAEGSLLELPLAGFLEALAARSPAPAAGSACAAVASIAAALGAMTARASRGRWDGAADALDELEAARARLRPLADLDAEAYAGVLAAGTAERAAALVEAAGVPLSVAEACRDVARAAARLAAHGHPPVRPDAASAAILAAAAARAAALLVDANVGDDRPDGLRARARAAAAAAETAAREAVSP